MPKENGFVYQYKQQDVRHVSERYIAKSDPYIVLVSTPNGSGGSFERIEKEPEETCLTNVYCRTIIMVSTKYITRRNRKSKGFSRF